MLRREYLEVAKSIEKIDNALSKFVEVDVDLLAELIEKFEKLNSLRTNLNRVEKEISLIEIEEPQENYEKVKRLVKDFDSLYAIQKKIFRKTTEIKNLNSRILNLKEEIEDIEEKMDSELFRNGICPFSGVKMPEACKEALKKGLV